MSSFAPSRHETPLLLSPPRRRRLHFRRGCAAELPAIPSEPIAKKKELLFSDDFERAELGKAWAIVVPTFSIENGTLKGTQMRFDTPAVEARQAQASRR